MLPTLQKYERQNYKDTLQSKLVEKCYNDCIYTASKF